MSNKRMETDLRPRAFSKEYTKFQVHLFFNIQCRVSSGSFKSLIRVARSAARPGSTPS